MPSGAGTSSRALVCLLFALCAGLGAGELQDATSLLQRRTEVRHAAGGGKKQGHGALVASSALLHGTPFDPPGAPCVNCDENGVYRQPGRDNCTVSPAEGQMVHTAVSRLKAHPYDYTLVNDMMSFVMMALVCSDYLNEKGGFDAIFSVLKNADNMPDRYSRNQRNWFEMNGWMALSDQSISGKAAPIIANYGGPNKGIEFMVQRLQAHHRPLELVFDMEHFARARPLTLRYEITCNIQGILYNDKEDQEWAEAAVKAGLLRELLYTMKVERDASCSAMWASCSALGSLLSRGTARSASYKAQLIKLGAVEITRQALLSCTPYKPHGDMQFMAGMTWGQIHPADQLCGNALQLLTS